MNVQEISLGEICSSPRNPRRHEDKKKLEELAASIKQKGVIEPILVRAAGKGAKVRFEIVAGERRWKAAAMAGLAKIPCLVRELSDDEAYDFMLIENLQREDLTDAEEAHGFRAYVDLHYGDHIDEPAAIGVLAGKTGISPGYIRSRLRILTLPSRILKLFDKGELLFGHLQQLLRVADDKKTLDETIEWIFEDMAWGDKRLPAVKELGRYIDDLAPALSSAFFPTAAVCSKCASNSTVQKSLFDVEAKGALCLNPACFKKCQAAFLDENWKTTDLAKRHRTNGYRFVEDLPGQHQSFYGGQPGKKCAACDKFITAIEIGGKVHSERLCVGDQTCYNLVRNPRSEKERATGERDSAAPRASWHGEFFRDVFLTKRIPEELAKVDQRDTKIRMLLLACAIHGHRNETGDRHGHAAWILEERPDKATKAFKDVIQKIVLSGQHVGPSNWNGFGTKGRRLVAEYLGIDLAKEFAVDADYLKAKTKAEILAFAKKFKLPRMAGAAVLKKADLVRLVLENGKGLVGKVPAEILK